MSSTESSSEDAGLRRLLAEAIGPQPLSDDQLDALLSMASAEELTPERAARIVERSLRLVAEAGQRGTVVAMETASVPPRSNRFVAGLALTAAVVVLCGVALLAPRTASGPGDTIASRRERSRAESQTALRERIRMLNRAVPTRLTAKARPEAVPADLVAAGDVIETGPTERRRVSLPDQSVLFVNSGSRVTVAAARTLKLDRGEVFVDASDGAPGSENEPFVVEAAGRVIQGTDAAFSVEAIGELPTVLVTRGTATVSGVATPITAGVQLLAMTTDASSPDEPKLAASSGEARADQRLVAATPSVSLDWMRELVAASSGPLIARSEHAGGALVTVDPNGQSSRLSLRAFHVDVHVEDGFARTTIDQTYFNHTWNRLEGTFHFPLPTDASLSRLAMYVNGKLMEGGMAERQHARNTFEQIVHKMQDPALLEWVDGSTFKMRVFPLEPRQEKRIVLSYSQRLESSAGQLAYRFPAGHSMDLVRDWSARVRVRNGAGAEWQSGSHQFTVTDNADGDLLLDASLKNALLNRDLVVRVNEPHGPLTPTLSPEAGEREQDAKRIAEEVPLTPTLSADPGPREQGARWSSMVSDGFRYQMLRLRPKLAGDLQRAPHHWVVLFEHAGDRTPLLARAQIETVRVLLEHAEATDTFSIVTASSRPTKWRDAPQVCSKENITAAIHHLEAVHLVGALDLAAGLKSCGELLVTAAAVQPNVRPVLLHVGSGMPALGERDAAKLAALVPESAQYLGIGIGQRWNLAMMKQAASRTGGLSAQINPDEDIAWRAFDLSSKLHSPRLVNVSAATHAEASNVEAPAFLLFSDVINQSEEIAAICRVPESKTLPERVVVTATLNGQPWRQELTVTTGRTDAAYLPRHWAKLEIDRLLAADAAANREQIVALSKAMYVMSPFTSLLVLENEEMYTQFSIDRGRKDHWALYPCPDQIEVVVDQSEPAPVDAVVQTGPKTRAQILATVVRLPVMIHQPSPALLEELARERGGMRRRWYRLSESEWDDGVMNGVDGRGNQGPALLYFEESRGLGLLPLQTRALRSGTTTFETLGKSGDFDGYWMEPGRDTNLSLLNTWEVQPELAGFAFQPAGGEPASTVMFSLADLYVRPDIRLEDTTRTLAASNFFGRYIVPPGVDDFGVMLGDEMRESKFLVDELVDELVDRVEFESLSYVVDSTVLLPSLDYFGGDTDRDGIQLIEAMNGDLLSLGRSTGEMPDLQQLVEDREQSVELAKWPDEMVRMSVALQPVEAREKVLAQLRDDRLGWRFRERRLFDDIGFAASRRGGVPVAETTSGAVGHRWGGNSPSSISGIRVPTSNVQSWISVPDPRRLCDLMSAAPGLNSNTSDMLAVLDAERPSETTPGSAMAGTPAGVTVGTIDEAARVLIDRARNAGWESITLPGRNNEAGVTVVYDGRGRHVWERLVGEGLREQVVCDGTSLWHTYRDIGLSAKRPFSRHHFADFSRLVPWLLPSADDLARGADIKLVDDHTVAIVPRRIGESAKSADKAASVEVVELRLRFGADGRLQSRSYVERGSRKVRLTIEFLSNGTVRWLDGDGRELSTLDLHRALAAEPGLIADTDGLIVLPMPVRIPDAILAGESTAGSTTPPADDALTEDTALALMLAYSANGNGARVVEIARRRFLDKGDTRDGLYVLLSRFPHALVQAAIPADPANPDAATAGFDVRPDVEGSPLKQFLRQSIDWFRDSSDAIPFVVAGKSTETAGALPDSDYLNRMATARNIAMRWSTGQATTNRTAIQIGEEIDAALTFLKSCRRLETGWMLISTMRSKLTEPAHLKAWSDAAARFESDPFVGSLVRRDRVSALATAGQLQEARRLFGDWLTENLNGGVVPEIGAELYGAVIGADGQAWMDELLLSNGRRLAAERQTSLLTMLAGQSRQLGNAAVAEQLLSSLLQALDVAERPLTGLLAVEQLRQSNAEQASRLMDEILEQPAMLELPALWRFASQVADESGRKRLALERLERAVQLEFMSRPAVVNIETIRADYTALLAKYDELISAAAALEVTPLADLGAKVVAAADQWRALDDDDTAACQTASRLLTKLGLHDLAWDYLTTPLAENSGESGPWKELARSTSVAQQIELSDMAWSRAFEFESTNPEILLEHARMLKTAGRAERSRSLLQQVVAGSWQPRFAGIVEQAKAEM